MSITPIPRLDHCCPLLSQGHRLSDMWLFRETSWQQLQPTAPLPFTFRRVSSLLLSEEGRALVFPMSKHARCMLVSNVAPLRRTAPSSSLFSRSQAAHTAVALPHSTSALLYGGNYGTPSDAILGNLLLLMPDTCSSSYTRSQHVVESASAAVCVPCPAGTHARNTTLKSRSRSVVKGTTGMREARWVRGDDALDAPRGQEACAVCPPGTLSVSVGMPSCLRCGLTISELVCQIKILCHEMCS